MAHINQQKYRKQLLGCMQIALNHLAPLRLDFDACGRIAIARQIDQIHGLIDIIKIDGLRLARLGRGTRETFAV